MLILDTNHLTELGYKSRAGVRLERRLIESGEEVVTTIVSIEEQLRGWLALIGKQADVHRQIEAYTALGERLEFLSCFKVLTWDKPSADLFKDFRTRGIRIGTMDLKIASIAMANDAVLLTRNLVDFERVPALRYENWLD
ncbi:type II toxin-antitoxin system VapC family toxin [Luteolibacter soli]|uniref:Type II toxin-antitoxin system VapC family toxin n=1 Tax=Luteolibacter soli TaxID=3135280 RepID=A0ABU9APQ7_9BACT